MTNSNNYCVIMGGGIGSRFWPYSRKNLPKQFLDFFCSFCDYYVIADGYVNRYIRHNLYMNRLSMKSKQFVNGYQRI